MQSTGVQRVHLPQDEDEDEIEKEVYRKGRKGEEQQKEKIGGEKAKK